MQTLDLKAQDGSYFMGQLSSGAYDLAGANQPYKCVNDSDGTSHDGDATYLRILTPAFFSFPLFRGSEHWIVGSFTGRIVLKNVVGAPVLRCRFFLAHQPPTVNEPNLDEMIIGETSGAFPDYSLLTQAVTTNPWTGQPFTGADLEATQIGFFLDYEGAPTLQQEIRITLVSGQATFNDPHNCGHDIPGVQGVA